MAVPNTSANPPDEEVLARILRNERRNARLPDGQAVRSSPTALLDRREGNAQRPRASSFDEATSEVAQRRELDAVRRQASQPLATSLGAQPVEEEEQPTEAPSQEGRLGQLLRSVRQQTRAAIGGAEGDGEQGTAGEAEGGVAGAVAGIAEAAVASAARQGLARVWDQLQFWLEGLAFTWVALLVAGPASLIVYLVRLLGGHVFRFRVRGVGVIPPYSLPTFIAHTVPNILIAVIFGALIVIIFVLVYLINNQCKAAELFSDELLGGVLSPLVGALKLVGVCPSS